MDAVRYWLAVVLLVAFPPALLSWLLIHPLAPFWRQRGPTTTYLVVVSVAAAIGTVIYRFREPLLAVEFGFRWAPTAVGLLILAAAVWLERQYRRQLSVATLLGLPEISARRQSHLLTEGIYARVRHPRYIGVLLETVGLALFVNYLATYVMTAALAPVLYLVVLLEERELRQRFGGQYDRYMRRVPRFFPRLGKGAN